jgi:hypothetical protein
MDRQLLIFIFFYKIVFFFQSIAQHPKLAPYITSARNEQIAMHFNDKLTSMEYILYNVAVVESDIYNGSKYNKNIKFNIIINSIFFI